MEVGSGRPLKSCRPGRTIPTMSGGWGGGSPSPPTFYSVPPVIQDGFHQFVISLDLLQEDHIEWGRVKSQQLPGPLIVDHLRNLLLHISSQL